ncbi:hypothetical protein D9M71_398600 [compost metagenome]
MLQPGDPAALHGFLELLLVHVLGGHFQVGLLGGPYRGAEIGGNTGGGGGGRIRAGVALELGEQIAVPGLGALVVDHIAHIHLVGVGIDALDLLLRLFLLAAVSLQTAMEGEALQVVDAVAVEVQIDDQLVLAIGKLIAGLGAGIERPPLAGGIRTVAAGQAALAEVGALLVVLEQRERDVRTILTQRVLQQAQLHDVATARVDRQAEHVGLHLDQLVAGRCGLFGRQGGSGALRSRYIGTGSGRHRSIRQALGAVADRSGLRRQFGLAVILVPLENQHVGDGGQGDD